MPDPADQLKALKKTKDFFIGIDSDGCAFDTMEVKHKFCFVVAVLQAFGLAALARILRDVWDFVNLNGQTRGCNRWLALRDTFRYVRKLSPYDRFDGFLKAHLDVIDEFVAAADDTPEIQLSNDGLLRFAETRLDGGGRELLRAIVADPVTLANSPRGLEIVKAVHRPHGDVDVPGQRPGGRPRPRRAAVPTGPRKPRQGGRLSRRDGRLRHA